MALRLFRMNMGAAIAAGLMLAGPADSASAGQGASATIPRTADGKPDLTGVWRPTEDPAQTGTSGRGSLVGSEGRTQRTSNGFYQTSGPASADDDSTSFFPSRRCAPNQKGCRDNTNQANDYELTFRDDPNRPLYKAEHWDRVQFLDYDTNFSDPMFRCVPLGLPRVGPPLAVLPAPGGVALLYYGGGAGILNHDYRLVPTDGKAHDPGRLPGYWGNAVGRWEGDTLVVETTGFNDTTWVASGMIGLGGGYFHGFEMKVTERFRREGNTLRYQAIVEDPEVLLEPWVMNPKTLVLDPNPSALYRVPEGTPCENIDEAIAVNRIRH